MKVSDLLVKALESEGGVHLVVVPVNYDDNEPLLNYRIPAMCRELDLYSVR